MASFLEKLKLEAVIVRYMADICKCKKGSDWLKSGRKVIIIFKGDSNPTDKYVLSKRAL